MLSKVSEFTLIAVILHCTSLQLWSHLSQNTSQWTFDLTSSSFIKQYNLLKM